MDDKHTPGPRAIDEHWPNGAPVFDVYTSDERGDHLIATFQNRGDALLDAAAPTLLEALRHARDMFIGMGHGESDLSEGLEYGHCVKTGDEGCACVYVEQAIRAATGEES